MSDPSTLLGYGGRRVLISGGASGIGQELVRHIAALDGRVAILDRDAANLDRIAGELRDRGTTAFPFAVDVRDRAAVESAVNAATNQLGGLDMVASVAGWDQPGRFWEQPYELWEQLVGINLWGPLHLARAAVPLLRSGTAPSMVFVASDAGRVGSKGETVYAAAKAGVLGLTKSLARELAPDGVTVNCVCPGPTNTPLLAQETIDNPQLMEKLARAIPLRRIAEPDEPAMAILFLGSAMARYITGQTLSVSGGLTMVG